MGRRVSSFLSKYGRPTLECVYASPLPSNLVAYREEVLPAAYTVTPFTLGRSKFRGVRDDRRQSAFLSDFSSPRTLLSRISCARAQNREN